MLKSGLGPQRLRRTMRLGRVVGEAERTAPRPVGPRAGPGKGRGQALPLVALMMVALLGFMGLALDVSMLLLRTLQQQRAADAAAMAGVIKLPDDAAGAQTLARDYAARNGYLNNPGNFPAVDAQPVPGYTTRLRVTITAHHDVFFMHLFGWEFVPVTRTAEAVYSLPIHLGSPESYFGIGNKTPVAVANGPSPGNCPQCLVVRSRYTWASINGPGSNHSDGDAYNTRWMGGYVSGCPESGDLSYDQSQGNGAYVPSTGGNREAGYSYGIHVDPNQGGSDLTLYVYDPGQYYSGGVNGTSRDTGDSEQCGDPPVTTHQLRFTTNFQVYHPDFTPTYFGDDVPLGPLHSFPAGDATNVNHNKWVALGTLPSSEASIGDFRVQVTTDDSNGVGRNQYALAIGGARPPNNYEQVYGLQKMSLYNNTRAAQGVTSQWFLAKVPSEHANDRMEVRMFDPGDATCVTSMQLLNGTNPNGPFDIQEFALNWGQTYTILPTTVCDPTCHAVYNGQWVTLGVQLPNNYTERWWLIQYNIGASCASQTSSNDRTVWEINMLGSPIHIIPNDQ